MRNEKQNLAFRIFFDNDFIKLSNRVYDNQFKTDWLNQNKISSPRLYTVFRVLNEIYCEYVNNFITVDFFANYHGVNRHKMNLFIKIGRWYNHNQNKI